MQNFSDQDPHMQVGMIVDPYIPLKNVTTLRLKIFLRPIEGIPRQKERVVKGHFHIKPGCEPGEDFYGKKNPM